MQPTSSHLLFPVHSHVVFMSILSVVISNGAERSPMSTAYPVFPALSIMHSTTMVVSIPIHTCPLISRPIPDPEHRRTPHHTHGRDPPPPKPHHPTLQPPRIPMTRHDGAHRPERTARRRAHPMHGPQQLRPGAGIVDEQYRAWKRKGAGADL